MRRSPLALKPFWPGLIVAATICFTKAQAAPALTLSSPLDYQVIQRTSRSAGLALIRGDFSHLEGQKGTIEARLVVNDQPLEWQPVVLNSDRNSFEARLEAPAGGWHRLEVRAVSGDTVLAEASVPHVGVGEIFVIA